MRKLLASIGLCALCLLQARGNGDFGFPWTDAQGNPLPLRKVYLYPDDQTRAALNAAGITTLDRITSQTATNGSAVVSNLVAGRYRAEFVGTYTISTNWFNLPQTNGFQWATNWIENPTIYAGVAVYSTAAADGKFWGKGELSAGSNVTFRSSGGQVFIDAAAGSGMPAGVLTNGQAAVSLSGQFTASSGVYYGDLVATNDANSGDLNLFDERNDGWVRFGGGVVSASGGFVGSGTGNGAGWTNLNGAGLQPGSVGAGKLGSGAVEWTNLTAAAASQVASTAASQATSIIATPQNYSGTFSGTVTGTFTGNGAAMTNFLTNASSIWVDRKGSDSAGVVSQPSMPFSTLSHVGTNFQGYEVVVNPGKYQDAATTLAFTNLTIRGYGAVFTNKVSNGSNSKSWLVPVNSTIWGLSITNAIPDDYQTGLGETGTAGGVMGGTRSELHDVEMWADHACISIYATSNHWMDIWNSKFHGKAMAVNTGSGNYRWFNSLFEAIGPSPWADDIGSFFTTSAFVTDGNHIPNIAATNQFFGCPFRAAGEGDNYALDVEWHSRSELYGCSLDASDYSGLGYDQSSAIRFNGESNMFVFAFSSLLKYGGATNRNLAVDAGYNPTCSIYLMNSLVEPATNGVCVDNPGGHVYVSGGNLIPSNFSNPTNVTWLTPPQPIYGSVIRITALSPITNHLGYLTVTNYGRGIGNLTGLNPSAGTITNTQPGTYLISGTLSFDAGIVGDDLYDLAIFTNGVLCADSPVVQTVTAGNAGTLHVDNMLYLPANTRVDQRWQCEVNDGQSINIRNGNLSVQMISP